MPRAVSARAHMLGPVPLAHALGPLPFGHMRSGRFRSGRCARDCMCRAHCRAHVHERICPNTYARAPVLECMGLGTCARVHVSKRMGPSTCAHVAHVPDCTCLSVRAQALGPERMGPSGTAPSAWARAQGPDAGARVHVRECRCPSTCARARVLERMCPNAHEPECTCARVETARAHGPDTRARAHGPERNRPERMCPHADVPCLCIRKDHTWQCIQSDCRPPRSAAPWQQPPSSSMRTRARSLHCALT